MNASLLLFIASGLAVVCATVCWWEVRRKVAALPRLRVITGHVRELESVLSDRTRGSINSTTLVNVSFSVEGRDYTCRDLYFFGGNRHVGDVGKRFDFPVGQPVGVHYDPVDPRRCALIVDKPAYTGVFVCATLAFLFGVMAILRSL